MATQAPQAPTGACRCPGLAAIGPRVPILALAAVGKSIQRHALSVDTPGGTEKSTVRQAGANPSPPEGSPPHTQQPPALAS